MKKTIGSTLLATALLAGTAAAMEPSHLEHKHSARTVMFDYRYMHMTMDGLGSGTDEVSPAQATAMMGGLCYMMATTEMTMAMHMAMPMYNFTAQWSVMAMFQYLDKRMTMVDRNGVESTMATEGPGDTVLMTSYKFDEDRWAVALGVSLPTGAIDQTVTMMGNRQRAPYAMQLGSGTVDLTPSVSYLGAYYQWRFGAQLSYTRRLGENDAGYRLGDEARALAWVHRPVGRLNLWLKGWWVRWGDIEGADPAIPTQTTMMGMTMKTTPTAATRNYGGRRLDLGLAADTPLWGPFTLGVEWIRPVLQDLNGDAQMRRGDTLLAYLQYMY